MLSYRSISALAISLALSALPSRAATMDVFTFTSPVITGPLTTTFPASPTPVTFTNGVSFTLDGTVTFEGNTVTGPISFLNAGGASEAGITFSGPPLFSGTDANPTFLLGSFNLAGSADIGNGGVQPVNGVLVISQPSIPPVPEPGSLALTGIGVLAIAGYLRGRHRELRTAGISC